MLAGDQVRCDEATAAAIAARVAAVRARITAACDRAGRDPATVTLVAAGKTQPAAIVAAAVAAGITDIGENRVQEAAAKRAALDAAGVRPVWHLIGHLQTNKVRSALQTFDILQTVDSPRLAHAISRTATRSTAVLLEVNVAGEASKFGLMPELVAATIQSIATLPNLVVRGLMTVAPAAIDPEDVRPVFRRLRTIAAALDLPELSMGMTSDYTVAVEEGATMVRVGRAIFGDRLPSPPP